MILHYTAFSDRPDGGNRAGVVIDPEVLTDAAMLKIAADVGYSETAFIWTSSTMNVYRVRYFSPAQEVPFCGHATIAAGVALADRGAVGDLKLHTNSGEVVVSVTRDDAGLAMATLTSVLPEISTVSEGVIDETLAALRWAREDLDTKLPCRSAYAGAKHLVMAARTRERLADLTYDFDAVRTIMSREGWTTLQVVWRENQRTFHARDPFAVGGVVEDAATGAAAAALGAYLRDLDLVEPPTRVTIHQGVDMGRPSILWVDIDPGHTGIRVSGNAVPIRSAGTRGVDLPALTDHRRAQ